MIVRAKDLFSSIGTIFREAQGMSAQEVGLVEG